MLIETKLAASSPAGVIASSAHPESGKEQIASKRRRALELIITVALTCSAAIILRMNSITLSTIDWDEGVYFVIAQQWLAGHLPYLKVWDQHPVGLPAILALVGILGGDILLGARLAATLATGLTAAVLFCFCQRFLSSRKAGVVAAVLYLLGMSQGAALAVQTEVFNNLLVSAAAFILLREGASRDRHAGGSLVHLFTAGLMLGTALQVKYVALPEAVLLSLGYLILGYRRDRSVPLGMQRAALLITGGLLPTITAIITYWHAGKLPEFFQANILANLQYVSTPAGAASTGSMILSGLKPLSGLSLGLAVLLIVTCRYRVSSADRLVLSWIALWLVAAIIDVCLPLKFWDHYFEVLLPPMALLAAFSLTLLSRSVTRHRRALTYLILLLMVFPGVYLAQKSQLLLEAKKRDDIPRLVADAILRAGSTGRDVYVFNYEPVVYYLASAMPPTRYVLPAELAAFSRSSGAQPELELRSILNQNPRFIVTADPGLERMGATLDTMLARHLDQYEVLSEYTHRVGKAGKIAIYIRSR